MGPNTWTCQCWPDQQELIYINSVRAQDVIWKTCREQWGIGADGERQRNREIETERESGKSLLAARLDDGDLFIDLFMKWIKILKIMRRIC